ncbi:MAG: phage holin family protein [Pirellulaceae bacterium]
MSTRSDLGRVARDVIDLFELQMQLFSVDSQEARRKAVKGIVYLAIAIPLAGSALTAAMIGGGFLLHELAEWSIGASMLTIAAVTFVIVLALLIATASVTKSAGSAMEESKSEFVENIKWIKAILVSPKTSARNQLRAEDFPDADFDDYHRDEQFRRSSPHQQANDPSYHHNGH